MLDNASQEINPADIIQITDESHPWFPALLIVDEVRSWGVIAYALIPQPKTEGGGCSSAFNHIEQGKFNKVGTALYACQPNG